MIVNVLNRLEKRSNLEKSRRVNVASDERMLAITKDTGELINMILRIKKAKNMLEIGMSVGYSTIWCADIIKENRGSIFTIEKNPKKINMAKKNFDDAGVSNIVKIQEGVAMNILKEFCGKKKFQNFFDFVLIDADKENVIEYFKRVFPLVKINGIIITDNMLYPEKYRKEMKKFSNYLRKNRKVKSITSSIGNGEEITIKIRN